MNISQPQIKRFIIFTLLNKYYTIFTNIYTIPTLIRETNNPQDPNDFFNILNYMESLDTTDEQLHLYIIYLYGSMTIHFMYKLIQYIKKLNF